MGNCIGVDKLPENMFHVVNIGDDRRLDKGMMQVTETELIFTDRKTTESWRWPLKFLRKYGCDGEVFSFEAGRKCPGGEGLYAFESKRASQIFDMVARNINQGNLQPPAGELSPFPSESRPVDQNTLVSRTSVSLSPGHMHTDQPNYANMDLSGNPLVQAEEEPAIPQRPVAYKEVIFDRPPEQHPVPQGEKEQRTSYTRIDFVGTDSYNRERRLGTLPEVPYTPQGRTSTSSMGSGGLSSHRAGGGGGGKRGRMHTYSGPGSSTGGRLPSDSSFSSQGSLTESSRDVRPSQSSMSSGAGGHAHSSVTLDTAASSGTALYQNVLVSKDGASVQHSTTPLPQQQQQYQNVTVGAGSVGGVFDSPTSSTPQPLSNGNGHVATSTPRSASTSHGAGLSSRNGFSPIVNGHPMAHYADLELGKNAARHQRERATSTPAGTKAPNISYSVMDFPLKEGKSSPNHHHSSVSSAVPQPNASGSRAAGDSSPPIWTPNGDIRGRHHLHSMSSSRAEEPVESVVSPIPIPEATAAATTANGEVKKVQDETKVEYGVLNFPAMEVLAKKKAEHLRDDERDHSHSTSSRKKKNKSDL